MQPKFSTIQQITLRPGDIIRLVRKGEISLVYILRDQNSPTEGVDPFQFDHLTNDQFFELARFIGLLSGLKIEAYKPGEYSAFRFVETKRNVPEVEPLPKARRTVNDIEGFNWRRRESRERYEFK